MSEPYDAPARGFAPFPPNRGRTRRGQSWWARAWVEAMVATSLDPGRLTRGRGYANGGRVGSITVSPGRIAAPVHGSRSTPYRTVVHVEQLSDEGWERFLDQVAARAGFIAALLDRDMPNELVEAAADAGVALLPTVGDLDPECSCPDWGYPCKHAAALCYQASWLLDEDPFVLLLMRGRGERELVDELQRRNAAQGRRDARGSASADDDWTPVLGTPAAVAYAGEPGPPPVLPDPLVAGPAAAALELLAAVPPAPGVDPAALRILVADAAHRARALLLGADAAPQVLGEADAATDAVRLAATQSEALSAPAAGSRLRRTSGRTTVGFTRAVAAWEQGGRVGLDVLEGSWTPDPSDLARARDALLQAWEDSPGGATPTLRAWRNRWTVSWRVAGASQPLVVQLRLGRDGRWYPYRSDRGDWVPSGHADHDPVAALDELVQAQPEASSSGEGQEHTRLRSP